MTQPRHAFTGAAIFDGTIRHSGHALVIEAGQVAAIVPEAELDPAIPEERLTGGLICPGFVDLQVNGGGGVMLNDDRSVAALSRMVQAHARLGATSILPTLITDGPDKVSAAIDAVEQAIAQGVPGILGLHLEGPHLSVARKGAHDAGLIRPMGGHDLDRMRDAARRLPVLMLTVAPETVTPAQIETLADAGVIVSIGHSDAGFETCIDAAGAGATCVTHLFNAMRQLGNREPGVVGAALSCGGLSAGLIVDGHHVHPEAMRIALRAKQGPGRIFLVSDAMAVAGTDTDGFDLGERRVLRRGGRLTLEDGTLAGADLDLLTAVRNLLRWKLADADTALAMATDVPARLIHAVPGIGALVPGGPADFLHVDLAADAPATVWKAGRHV